ncbi:MAG: thioredoxin family protein, partial [Nitrososphaerota archaeon]
TAHKFAIINKNIKADVIEAIEFPKLARKYNVFAVPKIIINDTIEFEGAVPEEFFLNKILEALEKSE